MVSEGLDVAMVSTSTLSMNQQVVLYPRSRCSQPRRRSLQQQSLRRRAQYRLRGWRAGTRAPLRGEEDRQARGGRYSLAALGK